MDETIRMLFFTGIGILVGVLLFFFTGFSDFETASADLEDAKFWYDAGFDEGFDNCLEEIYPSCTKPIVPAYVPHPSIRDYPDSNMGLISNPEKQLQEKEYGIK